MYSTYMELLQQQQLAQLNRFQPTTHQLASGAYLLELAPGGQQKVIRFFKELGLSNLICWSPLHYGYQSSKAYIESI